MKKLFLLIALALPFLAFTSCDDDDKLPNVDVTVQFEGVTRVGNTLYVVKDQPIDIVSVTIKDNTNKGAVIGAATYFWDYYRVASNITTPYGLELETEGIPTGNHLLQISISIYAVDYSPCVGFLEYKVVIVENEADIPTQGDVEQNPNVKVAVTANDAEK